MLSFYELAPWKLKKLLSTQQFISKTVHGSKLLSSVAAGAEYTDGAPIRVGELLKLSKTSNGVDNPLR